tara:strand:+ start:321 stop:512 length:192 start_codon:yes stop_codon:yes gene_type:complete
MQDETDDKLSKKLTNINSLLKSIDVKLNDISSMLEEQNKSSAPTAVHFGLGIAVIVMVLIFFV